MKDQKGFSIIEIMVVVLVVVTAGFIGWFVYHAKHTTDKTLTKTNDSSKTASIRSVDDDRATPRYLNIKEWGVKIPLTSDITDAYYMLRDTSVDVGSETVGLSTGTATRDSDACAANRMAIIGITRQTAATHDANVGKTDTQTDPHPVYPKKIGTYYYQSVSTVGKTEVGHEDGLCGKYDTTLEYAKQLEKAFQGIVASE